VVPRALDLPGRPGGSAALLLLRPAAPAAAAWIGLPAGDADPLGLAFEQIVRGTTEAVVAIDAAQRIVHFNQGAERLFGWAAEAVVGQPLGVLLPEAVRDAHAAHVSAYMAGQGAVRWMNDRSDIAALKADGTVFPAEATILASGQPDTPVYAAVLRDVTARRETEARLREHVAALKQARHAADMANRAKSEFLAGMSHELRTPLNAIIGFAQLMTEGLHGPLGAPQYADYVRDIRDSGEHLLRIVNDILDVSRIETGHIQLALDSVALAEVLESCRRLIAPRALAGCLHLDVDPGPPGLKIEVDPRYLKQVLINLLANAVKFTPEAGRITLAAARTADGGVEISVADTGVGIAVDQLERIFEPFVQGDGSLARRFEGSGLGLSLVRSLIELHGGTASIDSAVGAGTKVRLTLPPKAVIDANGPRGCLTTP
jgi:PAS domain S-box-containing protein